jgi:putative zinc finger/helix-turn-helix YgiT family protein
MAEPENEADPVVARSRLLALLNADEWELSDRAEREAMVEAIMSEQASAMNPRCPECATGHLSARLTTEEFDFNLGEETIKVRAENVPIQQCDSCGIVIRGPAAAKVQHEAICKAAGFFTPSEIRELRDRLGLSQEEFARLAGVGTATISRWERGRLLQNRSSDNLLFLIAERPENRQLLRERLTSRTRSQDLGPTSANGASLAPASQGTQED